MLGIEPSELDPGFFMTALHLDDGQRLGLARVKMMKVVQEIYASKSGSTLVSLTLRFLNPEGKYNNLLVQAYLFHITLPSEAVFLIQVVTNVDHFKKVNLDGHYYVSDDVSLFKSVRL